MDRCVTWLAGALVLLATTVTFAAEGAFVFLPGDMPHSLWTTTVAAEIQVSGTGPFGLHDINPADDPGLAK